MLSLGKLWYAMVFYDEWESNYMCYEIPMLWYEFSMLWHEISMPCYAMVHVVKDMHGLTVTQHSTYTRHYVHIYKITNTQEVSPPPPIIIHYVLH